MHFLWCVGGLCVLTSCTALCTVSSSPTRAPSSSSTRGLRRARCPFAPLPLGLRRIDWIPWDTQTHIADPEIQVMIASVNLKYTSFYSYYYQSFWSHKSLLTLCWGGRVVFRTGETGCGIDGVFSSPSEELLSLPVSLFIWGLFLWNIFLIICLYWLGWMTDLFFKLWEWSTEPRFFRARGISARIWSNMSISGTTGASGATTGCKRVGLRGRGADSTSGSSALTSTLDSLLGSAEGAGVSGSTDSLLPEFIFTSST